MKQFFNQAKIIIGTALISMLVFGINVGHAEETIPQLLGKWQGENKTYSDAKGYQSWTKTIEITEQRERIFKGSFTYFGGTKEFFGVIYPDNSLTWVSKPAKGYVQGKVQSANQMTACYVETGENATVGCVELHRQ